jgi:hypothetical protein
MVAGLQLGVVVGLVAELAGGNAVVLVVATANDSCVLSNPLINEEL